MHRSMVQAGKGRFRRLKRAQVLLAPSSGSSDVAIAKNLSVGASTVYRTKRRFVEEGLDAALSEEPRPGADRKLAAKEEALLIATACAAPRIGRARWTLALLAGEMVRLTDHDSLSTETIRRRLGENKLKPWLKKMWCIPKVDAEFVARMEAVFDLYAEEPDEKRPVVCFDETPRQLISEARVPVAAKPGKTARFDYEYVRNGTANVFMFVDVNRPWRHAKVTDRRACGDFAECMRDLVDVHYPKADRIRVRTSAFTLCRYADTNEKLQVLLNHIPQTASVESAMVNTVQLPSDSRSTFSPFREASCAPGPTQ